MSRKPKIGDAVVLNIPRNNWLHDMHATVKAIRPNAEGEGVYYVLASSDLPTGEFRAHQFEFNILHNGRILDTGTTGTVHEAAKLMGFTGDMCGQCGGARMVRNGSCLRCNDCGTTSGCG